MTNKNDTKLKNHRTSRSQPFEEKKHKSFKIINWQKQHSLKKKTRMKEKKRGKVWEVPKGNPHLCILTKRVNQTCCNQISIPCQNHLTKSEQRAKSWDAGSKFRVDARYYACTWNVWGIVVNTDNNKWHSSVAIQS